MANAMKNRRTLPAPFAASAAQPLTQDYLKDFGHWISGGGGRSDAALYIGNDGAGGYALPVTVSGAVVPLAPQDSVIRRIATVMPTTDTVSFPIIATSGTATVKPESGATVNSFTGASLTLGQFTLSAFQVGVPNQVSTEFAADIPSFMTFLSQDAALDVDTLEESLFIGGTGIQQPQGLLGNVGAGVTAALADANAFPLSIDATFDVLTTLKSPYHANASWLMSRSTGVQLRKAAKAAGLSGVFTREEGQDYLHGYPVEYSGAMPAIAPGSTPVLFGDFAFGYLIGDRGGSGLSVKILDQLSILQGRIQFIAYRRVDGRVRRPEAIQSITLHA